MTASRILIGVFEIKQVAGLFVVIDRQVAQPANVPPFTVLKDAIAWCTANSSKARRR